VDIDSVSEFHTIECLSLAFLTGPTDWMPLHTFTRGLKQIHFFQVMRFFGFLDDGQLKNIVIQNIFGFKEMCSYFNGVYR